MFDVFDLVEDENGTLVSSTRYGDEHADVGLSDVERRFQKQKKNLVGIDASLNSEIGMLSREIKDLKNSNGRNAVETRASLMKTKLDYYKARIDTNKEISAIEKTVIDLTIKLTGGAGGKSAVGISAPSISNTITAKDVAPEIHRSIKLGLESGERILKLEDTTEDTNVNNGVTEVVVRNRQHAVDALMNPDNVKKQNVTDEDDVEREEEVKSFVDKNYDIAQHALSSRCIKPDENGKIKKIEMINICKVDKSEGKFWYETRDINGNIISEDIKHIDFMKTGAFNFKDGFATDIKGDRFIIEEASANEMPDVYKKQWSLSSKPVTFENVKEETVEIPQYMNGIVEEDEEEEHLGY